jgi:hypothetical protein
MARKLARTHVRDYDEVAADVKSAQTSFFRKAQFVKKNSQHAVTDIFKKNLKSLS